ncbi:RAI1 like PD-XK nuclease-domain-containing protein [Gaertneriomyces semiglobifer]|nr:RAI1 like PD-XK nuclease-domain-containing protein [Gaertneriomyces semiglobifer]
MRVQARMRWNHIVPLPRNATRVVRLRTCLPETRRKALTTMAGGHDIGRRFNPYREHNHDRDGAQRGPRRSGRNRADDSVCIASFPVYPLEKWHTRCAPYQQPKELGYFSYDEHRGMHWMSDKELNWYYEPDLADCDLNDGFPHRYITRAPVAERLDALLSSLQKINRKAEAELMPTVTPRFCTWRGIMTRILCTPYSKDEWELGVTLFKGTIYMEEHESEEKRLSAFGGSDRDKLMSYYGYKFESLSTIDKPPSQLKGPGDEALQKRKTAVVNTNIQFCSVFKTKLGSNSLVLGAEVDCLVNDQKPLENPQSAYAELKTNRIISTPNQQRSFERHKLLKIWAQSFLPGIPKVIIGYRTDDGHIRSVEHLKTMEIPRMVRGKQANIWDATVCLNFANGFLDWLTRAVTEDDPDVVYTVRFAKPFQEVQITEKIRVDPVSGSGSSEASFIPVWFR